MSSRRVILYTTRCVHASVPTNSFFLRSFLCREMHFGVEMLCSLFPLMKENLWDSRCFLWKATMVKVATVWGSFDEKL